MPPRLRALCDGVRTGDDNGLCLRVRPDVALPMAELAERRRFLAALRVADYASVTGTGLAVVPDVFTAGGLIFDGIGLMALAAACSTLAAIVAREI